MRQVQDSHTEKLPSNKTLIVLGNDETGKTTLISKLANNDSSITKGAGLEYNFLDIRDEYREESTKLGVWILDGDLDYVNLLSFAISESNFGNTCCLIVASMDQPWNIMNSLERWADVLNRHIELMGISEAKLKQSKQKLALKFLNYVSPSDEAEAKLVASKSNDLRLSDVSSSTINASSSTVHPNDPQLDDNTDGLDLSVDALKNNLGIPIIVVITKTDCMSALEKDYDYNEETFDFIQQAIRKFCLRYGAALFYVSTKTNTNCELLHKYLAHCIYDLPFKNPASVIAKESIFVPAGWDNQKKIEILNENIQNSADEDFNNCIIEPEKPQQASTEVEFVIEDDHSFLARLHNESMSRKSDANDQSSQTLLANQTSSSPSQQRQDSLPPGENQNQSEGVLQNFFYSLLSNPQNSQNPQNR